MHPTSGGTSPEPTPSGLINTRCLAGDQVEEPTA